jgi:thioredoxin 2
MAALELDDRGILTSCSACGQVNRLAYDHLAEGLRCGRCKQPITSPVEPLEAGRVEDFDRLVAMASLPLIVDYWAPWCGPCRMVAPELVKVASRGAGRWMVVKVNTDVLTELGERFRIRSIPTMAVFAGGNEIARTTGARPAADIEAFVSNALREAPHEARGN